MFRCASELDFFSQHEGHGILSQDLYGPLRTNVRSNTLNPKLETILFDTDFVVTEIMAVATAQFEPRKPLFSRITRIQNKPRKTNSKKNYFVYELTRIFTNQLPLDPDASDCAGVRPTCLAAGWPCRTLC